MDEMFFCLLMIPYYPVDIRHIGFCVSLYFSHLHLLSIHSSHSSPGPLEHVSFLDPLRKKIFVWCVGTRSAHIRFKKKPSSLSSQNLKSLKIEGNIVWLHIGFPFSLFYWLRLDFLRVWGWIIVFFPHPSYVFSVDCKCRVIKCEICLTALKLCVVEKLQTCVDC